MLKQSHRIEIVYSVHPKDYGIRAFIHERSSKREEQLKLADPLLVDKQFDQFAGGPASAQGIIQQRKPRRDDCPKCSRIANDAAPHMRNVVEIDRLHDGTIDSLAFLASLIDGSPMLIGCARRCRRWRSTRSIFAAASEGDGIHEDSRTECAAMERGDVHRAVRAGYLHSLVRSAFAVRAAECLRAIGHECKALLVRYTVGYTHRKRRGRGEFLSVS